MPSPNATSRSDRTRISSAAPVGQSPSVQVVPVAGEGQASRTNQASRASAGVGQRQRAVPLQPGRAAPAGGAGAGADEHPGRRLLLGRPSRRRAARSGRSGGSGSRRRPRSGHAAAARRRSRPRPWCGARPDARRRPRPAAARRIARADAAPARRGCGRAPGSTPITGWPSRYFADVGDQAVLPDDHDDVVGREQEPGDVRPLEQAAPPVGRDRRGHLGQRRLLGLVALPRPRPGRARGCDRKNAAWPRVPCRASSSSSSVRRWTRTARGARLISALLRRAPGPSGRGAGLSRVSSGVSISGLSTRVSTAGRLPASSLSARPSSVAWSRSR